MKGDFILLEEGRWRAAGSSALTGEVSPHLCFPCGSSPWSWCTGLVWVCPPGSWAGGSPARCTRWAPGAPRPPASAPPHLHSSPLPAERETPRDEQRTLPGMGSPPPCPPSTASQHCQSGLSLPLGFPAASTSSPAWAQLSAQKPFSGLETAWWTFLLFFPASSALAGFAIRKVFRDFSAQSAVGINGWGTEWTNNHFIFMRCQRSPQRACCSSEHHIAFQQSGMSKKQPIYITELLHHTASSIPILQLPILINSLLTKLHTTTHFASQSYVQDSLTLPKEAQQLSSLHGSHLPA